MFLLLLAAHEKVLAVELEMPIDAGEHKGTRKRLFVEKE